MLPTLPASDPDPARRRATIEASRQQYVYAHGFPSPALPHGVAVSAQLPPDEGFPPDELVQVVATEGKVIANLMATDFVTSIDDLATRPSSVDLLSVARVIAQPRARFAAPTQAARKLSSEFPRSIQDYKRLFTLIRPTEIVGVLDRSQEVQDRAFAYQRVAGCGPLAIRGITRMRTGPAQSEATYVNGYPVDPPRGELPSTFALDAAVYQRAMGETDSLEAAIAERRLYVCDYRMLDGLPDGPWRAGVRFGYAPIAAFAVRKTTPEKLGELVPVAIQCKQSHGGSPENPVLTPADGVRWKMARTVVQSADGQLQELVFHLGRTHLVMEAVVLAARRSFAPWHPLMVLLAPHLQSTLSINDHAVHSLIAPGGQVEEIFAKTLAGSLECTTRGIAELDGSHLAPDIDAAHRLVEDREAFPDYPFRDDARELYPAIERFVSRYVALYYGEDLDVASDTELASFVRSLTDADEGDLSGIGVPTHRGMLARLIASLIWTASAQHSALNYAQFPMMGYVVNVPGAVYAPAPTASTPQLESEWTAMFPPAYLAASQFGTLFELSNVHTSRLGDYPLLHFVDRRVGALVADFRSDLTRIEAQVTGFDRHRLLSYPHLRPSRIGQSVFI